MFENMKNFFKKFAKNKKEEKVISNSKEAAKERLHLVLMQDRANVSADFLELMKQEIIEVIKRYIDIDEGAIDVRLTNKENEDGTNGAPALYANIPILNIKNEVKNEVKKEIKKENQKEENKNIESQEKHQEDLKEQDKTQQEQNNQKQNSQELIEPTKEELKSKE